jgi:hypothetical protein
MGSLMAMAEDYSDILQIRGRLLRDIAPYPGVCRRNRSSAPLRIENS